MKKGKKSIAMILYYEWSSDGRSKAAKDIYKKLGYEIFVFSTKEELELVEGGIKVSTGIKKYQGDSLLLFLLYHLVFIIQATIWLIKILLTKNITMIHVHNMPDYLLFVGIIGKLFGKKLIWDVRDITPAVWFSKKNISSISPYGLSYKVMLAIQNLCGLSSDFILCADKNQKQFLIENGIDQSKIKIFMNFPLKDVFNWIGPSNDKEKFRLVYHGSITYRLGLDIAVEAIHLIKNEIPSIKFDILGSGDYINDLRILIKQKNLDEFISLTPRFISIEQIPYWIRGAAGAIIPNRKTFVTENFMLAHKMFEYISMGIPIILPKLKIFTTYIEEDESCFFEPDDPVDLARAIKKLYFIDRERLAQNAIKFFNRNPIDENEKVLKLILEERI